MPMGNTPVFDSIVVGVGGMGSATCYELAKRGKRVLGLERFGIPHDFGSSHGQTRIIRLAYYEDPSYVVLLKRAYQLWDEIAKRAGEQLLYITGSIDAGTADSWVFKGSHESAMQYDLAHEVLTGNDMARRFPAYRFPDEILGLYQPQGGFVLPERSIVAYVNATLAMGGAVHGYEQVQEYVATSGGGVRVTTDRGTYEAGSLVFTGGAWSANLLPFLAGLAVPERQALAWLQPTVPAYFARERMPVFNVEVPEGRFYGFPEYGIPGFKFGKYGHFGEQGDADFLPRTVTRADEDLLRDFAVRYFPDGAGPTMNLKACLFTNSPDGHFILDRHPEMPQVSFAAGFSGHGYKFASVIGEIMADLAEHGKSRHDIGFFRLDRFAAVLA